MTLIKNNYDDNNFICTKEQTKSQFFSARYQCALWNGRLINNFEDTITPSTSKVVLAWLAAFLTLGALVFITKKIYLSQNITEAQAGNRSSLHDQQFLMRVYCT